MRDTCSHCGEDPARARGPCHACHAYEDRHDQLPTDEVLIARWARRAKIAELRRLDILRATIRGRIARHDQRW